MFFYFLGLLLISFSALLVIFSLIWWILGSILWGFLITALTSFVLGALLVHKPAFVHGRSHLYHLISFLVVFPFFLALPFWIDTPFSLVQSLFEGVATVTLSGYTNLSQSSLPQLIYFRSTMQWVSGFVILCMIISLHGGRAVPKTAAGIYELEHLNNLFQYCRSPLAIYFLLTVAAFTLLFLCGVSPGESFIYATGTVSTGGFTPDRASVKALGNVNAEKVIALFMFLSVAGYTVYGDLVKLKSSKIRQVCYLYFPGSVLVAGVVIGFLFWNDGWDGLFYFASAASTTGYFLDREVSFMPLIYALMIIGGCYGSLAGGIHVDRVIQVLNKLIGFSRTIFQSSQKGEQGMQFFVSYLFSFILLCLALSLSGLGLPEVMDHTIKTLSNSAPMGSEIPTSVYQQVVLMCSMILGRLGLVYLVAFALTYRREFGW